MGFRLWVWGPGLRAWGVGVRALAVRVSGPFGLGDFGAGGLRTKGLELGHEKPHRPGLQTSLPLHDEVHCPGGGLGKGI